MLEILNLKGPPNSITDSRVLAIFLHAWNLPLGEASSVEGLQSTGLSRLANRSGVAGAVLQTPSSFIDSVSESVSLFLPSSRYHKSQTIRARELKFCSPPTTCNMSCGTCNVSHVTCHVSYVIFFFYKVVKLIGGVSVINGAYPV